MISGTEKTTPLRSQLAVSAPVAAKRLLGSVLEYTHDDAIVSLKIVETEAYDETDAASHSYKGRTSRTDIMFGSPGHLYVYFTYGMHYCCNVVTGQEGEGSAVLIRAVEPLNGRQLLERRRHKKGIEVTNGPAKLCQALGINKAMNGHDLMQKPLRLIIKPPLESEQIIVTPRIGITQAKDVLWRFYIKDNPYVSRVH